MNSIRKENLVIKMLLGFLVLTAFVSALRLDLGAISLNLTQVTAILLIGLLMVNSLMSARPVIVLYRDIPSILIYLYLITNLFSSILFSPHKMESLKGCAVIATYVLIYVTVRWTMKFLSDKEFPYRRLLTFNYVSANFGLVSMVIAIATGTEFFGVTYGQLAQSGLVSAQSTVPSIQSFSIEPNLFAIITAVVLCINLSIYFLWKKSKRQLLTISLLSLAILFSYTRSVYISLAMALICIMFLSKQIKLIRSIAGYSLVVLVIITIVFLLLPEESEIKTALITRANSLFDFNKGSGLGRLHGFQIGWEGFLKNPFFGNGTLSANTRFYNIYEHKYQDFMGSPGWLNGTFIQSLQDTGMIGLLVVAGVFSSMIITNHRLFLKLDNTDIRKSIVLGFLGGNIILLIASQLSSPLWISFPYVYWAINMTFVTSCKADAPHREAT